MFTSDQITHRKDCFKRPPTVGTEPLNCELACGKLCTYSYTVTSNTGYTERALCAERAISNAPNGDARCYDHSVMCIRLSCGEPSVSGLCQKHIQL